MSSVYLLMVDNFIVIVARCGQLVLELIINHQLILYGKLRTVGEKVETLAPHCITLLVM